MKPASRHALYWRSEVSFDRTETAVVFIDPQVDVLKDRFGIRYYDLDSMEVVGAALHLAKLAACLVIGGPRILHLNARLIE